MLVAAASLAAALALGAPGVGLVRAAELAPGAFRRPDLAVRFGGLGAPPAAGGLALELPVHRPRTARGPGASSCLGDVCAPRVEIPGFTYRVGRGRRSELFVALLTRARIEPLATMAWAFVSTGLRLDYQPASFDGPNTAGGGWGAVWLRLKVRIDANHRVVIPPRPR